MKSDNFGLYVHIPFCVAKCSYCNFVSFKCENQNIQQYVDFLCEEIKEKANLAKDKVVENIYIGGGTPSVIEDKYIGKILFCIKENYNVCKTAEISIECNPCTANKEKLQNYFSYGINRISFGVQSLNDEQLKILGRKHSRQMAINAINMAKEVGFKNISADVMIGIPNQTQEDILDAVKQLCTLGINHISTYMLMLEEKTPLFKMVNSGKVKIADDDLCVDMYNKLYDFLKQCGFHRYEISNYCLSGYECRNNVNYWEMGEYLGFGVSAHSFLNGERFSNSNLLQKYYLKQDKTIEKLTMEQIIEETIMLGLRQANGINLQKIKNLGFDILKEKTEEIKNLLDNKIITINGDNLFINEKHFGVCSRIILMLIP